MSLRLRFAAISDVGRVRKDNQDSGYAGPWLLTVCDGVGGAAGGATASSTAVQQLRRLDAPPPEGHAPEELLGLVSGALHRAHDRLGEAVEHDSDLSGMATTATVAVFDGERLAVGHIGDSRAYLFRDGALSRLTHDHTFVQTLIDEGRISEEEAMVHPHRNLILRSLDGASEIEPDLFLVDLQSGDRLMLCSDGVSGSLPDGRLADVLATGTADYAAVELVRASLEAGSSDNVTCIVADVVPADEAAAPDETSEPLLVGAAAELRRKLPFGTSLFRGHRNGDTGELEPVVDPDVPLPPGAIPDDPIAPDAHEAARYAPRPPRRHPWLRHVLVLALVIGLVWVASAAAWSWTQRQYYVGVHDDAVTVFRGLDTSFAGVDLSEPYETTDLTLDRLSEFDADKVREGISATSLDDAHRAVNALAEKAAAPGATPPADPADASATPTATPSGTPAPTPAAPSTTPAP